MPDIRDLAIVSCHFNPCNYRSREQNLFKFLGGMRSLNLPVFVAELVFPGQSYLLPEFDKHMRTYRFIARDVMWHKEKLINLAVAMLPPQYTKIAWIDADVLFPDNRWYEKTSALLDTYHLVQLFDQVSQQTREGIEIKRRYSVVGHIERGKPKPFEFGASGSKTRPGLAWAATRALLVAHGLLDVMIVGGADTFMSLAAFGKLDQWHDWRLKGLTPQLHSAFERWAKPFFEDVRGNVSFLPTTVIQLSHGQVERRKYDERKNILARHNFDPARDIEPDSRGIWQWSSAKTALHAEVAAYFEQREEDV